MKTPKFVILSPEFMKFSRELDVDKSRIARHEEDDRTSPRISKFFVDGKLDNMLGSNNCTFVAGEIKDVPVQRATVIDVNDKEHDAQIVMIENKNIRYGCLVAPGCEEAERARQVLLGGSL